MQPPGSAFATRNNMENHLTKRWANIKTDIADYYRTSLADYYVSPAHRWLVYAVTFILAGLGAFGALTAYDIGDALRRNRGAR